MQLHSNVETPEGGAEELVPSRYGLMVGDIEVIVVSDGVLPLATDIMTVGVAPEESKAWFENQFLGPDAFDWGLNVLVIRTGDRTILVDSGLGGEFPGYPRAGMFPKRLKAAGIDLADVTDVIVTHMHMDHVGGLLTEAVKSKLNPDARIFISKTEVEFWRDPDFSKVYMPEHVPDALRASAKEFMNVYGNRLTTFDATHEVAPGVVVRMTGGHTPGHSVVHVTSGEDRLTFAADALFVVNFDHPEWRNGFEHDPEQARKTRYELLENAAQTGELLVATHLTFPSLGKIAREGDNFRYVPVIWDY